jgi:ribosomal protein S18 acetylase RimI-like enzyme
MTQIRPFRAGDEAALVALWAACELVRPWNDPHEDIRRKLALRDDLLLVVPADGELVGSVMAGYEGHRGWINYLAVAPSHRRHGLGRQLMREAEERLAAVGCPKINLQVRAGNADVLAFYEAIGYRVDEVVSLGKRLVDDEAPGRPQNIGDRARS